MDTEKAITDYKQIMNNITEAFKGNELIDGMNTFIDHIHNITQENKKLKEQLKDQQLIFKEERDDLLCQLSHSHEEYGKLKEKAQSWESLCDQTKSQLDKTMRMLNQTFESKDFYEKMFTELRSSLLQNQ